MENNVLSNKAGSFRDGVMSRVSGGGRTLHQNMLCGAQALD